MTPADPRLAILADLLKSYEEEYKEYTRIAAVVDDKAQKTVTIAATFLAAALAFVKPADITTLQGTLGPGGVVLLMVAVVAIVLCIISCLKAMFVRSIPFRVPAAGVRAQAKDLCALEADAVDSALRMAYLNGRIDTWDSTVKEMNSVVAGKSSDVKFAQGALFIGIMCVALTLFWMMGLKVV
jgi:hypothetical protein